MQLSINNLYIKAYQLKLEIKMKGLELPINVLVVVAVAVIVLLGVVGLFFAGFIGGSSAIS